MDSMIGQTIDNYKIVEIIGRGGMGIVYKAFDLSLEKTVALKMIDPFYARNESFVKRFKTEAKALAKLENTNIVSVYALRETENGLFMVMEYVKAKTVSEWLKEKGSLTINETINIVRQLLNAINHAHKSGVIHRDIKPNNILLCEDGTVKVMDFGLAKLIQEHGEQTTMTQTAGTLYYMSPEQIKGTKIDNRSDIYAIGMTVFEMLTGRTPFEKGTSEFDIQRQIIEGKIKSPDKFKPGIPKEFVKYIMKAVDKNADKRFHDINEMISGLKRLETIDTESDEKTRVMPDRTTAAIQTGEGKPRFIFAISGLVIIIVVAAVYFIFIKPSNNKEAVKQNNVKGSENLIDKTNTGGSGNKIKVASLAVYSSPPGAEVLIDGKSAGNTPLFKDSLQLIDYSIELRKDGYEKWQKSNYHLISGNNTISANLIRVEVKANSVLILKAVPSASIYIDGKKIASNSTSEIHKNIFAGRHTIKFVNTKFGTKELRVDLNKKQKKDITCYFQQQINIQSLDVNGKAFWGSIYINGKNTGKTTPGDVELGPGNYTITVKKIGYQTVEPEAVLNISPTFKLKTHSLVFHLK